LIAPPKGFDMNGLRRTAVAAGVFFLVTEVAAIAARVLRAPAVEHTDYVLGAGADGRVFLATLFEVILVLAIVGTAATLYPVVRKHSEGLAIGYAFVRLLEAVAIVVGIVSVLAVVSLRQGAAGTADAAALLPVNEALVAIHDWTFLVGPGWFLGMNSLLLAYLMYRSGLVPRFIAMLGMVGGPLIFASGIAAMYGVYGQVDTVGLIAALPVFAWEVSLALWLIFKGFKTPTLASDSMQPAAAEPALSPA
jgi:hypothetical protein